ncbi:unnamed protein product, partial [Prorocentrum cordatum]
MTWSSFQSSPRPVPVEGRLEKVREAFGEGQALVINSLHRWCPEAAQLASALRAQLGLPVDVYMYLTPPYSHSYGLHSDVMDAFMVQLVGRKHWLACSGENCTSVDTENGDVLYLPMRARHSAWTSGELSAHLTVNVERQFYVWGSVLQAVAKRLLLPGAGARLDGLADMKPFGLEEEGSHDDNELVRLICRSAPSLPALVQMPGAVLNHTRDGAELNGEGLEQELVPATAPAAAPAVAAADRAAVAPAIPGRRPARVPECGGDGPRAAGPRRGRAPGGPLVGGRAHLAEPAEDARAALAGPRAGRPGA